jgi:hypothetical protein
VNIADGRLLESLHGALEHAEAEVERLREVARQQEARAVRAEAEVVRLREEVKRWQTETYRPYRAWNRVTHPR